MRRTIHTLFKKISKTAIQAVLLMWMVPLFAFAECQTTTNPGSSSLSVQLANPLKVCSIEELLIDIINIVMILMIPVIVFYIIYSGLKYVMARGNASQVEEASQSLFYAILGGVLVLGAFALANIIESIVTAFQNTP